MRSGDTENVEQRVVIMEWLNNLLPWLQDHWFWLTTFLYNGVLMACLIVAGKGRSHKVHDLPWNDNSFDWSSLWDDLCDPKWLAIPKLIGLLIILVPFLTVSAAFPVWVVGGFSGLAVQFVGFLFLLAFAPGEIKSVGEVQEVWLGRFGNPVFVQGVIAVSIVFTTVLLSLLVLNSSLGARLRQWICQKQHDIFKRGAAIEDAFGIIMRGIMLSLKGLLLLVIAIIFRSIGVSIFTGIVAVVGARYLFQGAKDARIPLITWLMPLYLSGSLICLFVSFWMYDFETFFLNRLAALLLTLLWIGINLGAHGKYFPDLSAVEYGDWDNIEVWSWRPNESLRSLTRDKAHRFTAVVSIYNLVIIIFWVFMVLQ
jgi:hypothetical protein